MEGLIRTLFIAQNEQFLYIYIFREKKNRGLNTNIFYCIKRTIFVYIKFSDKIIKGRKYFKFEQIFISDFLKFSSTIVFGRRPKKIFNRNHEKT